MFRRSWSLVALLLIAALAVSGDAAAQCTDRDGDGYGRPGDAACPAGPETDCNDRSRTMHPGADEICDGLDNDCSGQIDDSERCVGELTQAVKVGGDIRITDDPQHSLRPTIAWNGSGYGAFFADDRLEPKTYSLFFAGTDALGHKTVDEHPIVTADNGYDVERLQVVWSGAEYGLVWLDPRHVVGGDSNGEIYFARFDREGNKIRSETRCSITPFESIDPQIAWSGAEYGIVWRDRPDSDSPYEIYFVRVTAEGASDPQVPLNLSGDTANDISIVWDGEYFALAANRWNSAEERRSIQFIHLDVYGNRIEPEPLTVLDDISAYSDVQLTWNGSEYGVWWTRADGDIFLTRLDQSGDVLATVEVTADTGYPGFPQKFDTAVWNGREYAMLWHYTRGDLPPFTDQLRFSRVSAAGEMLPRPPQVPLELLISTDAVPGHPTFGPVEDLAWSGRDWGLFWIDQKLGSHDLFFTRVAQDLDGDGRYGAADCNDQDNGVWSTPSAARKLRFSPDDSLWLWDEPLDPGGDGQVILYDVLRSTRPDDFYEADCLESDDDDLQAVDTSVPDPVGTAAYYQVRPQNDCGEAPLISAHTKMPISARSCP